jgi:hypothetical protein
MAFLPPPDPALTGRLCRLVLMVLLPALAERDAPAFGEALTEVQRLVGESFAPAQGGTYASPEGERLAREMGRLGALGVGQSSWGPAVFGFFDAPEAAERVRAALAGAIAVCREERLTPAEGGFPKGTESLSITEEGQCPRPNAVPEAELFLAKGMNRGARIRVLREPPEGEEG